MQRSIRFLLLAGFASAAAFAQSPQDSTRAESVDAMASTVAQMEKQTENGVKYVCGGIGINEVASLKNAASNYDLMMTFAASTGAFLADVGVEIADAKGNPVLNVNCDGPIMLVDLPKDGRYRVRAETEGRTLTRTAQVSERGKVQRIRMAWPVQVVDMGLSPTAGPQPSGSGMSSSGSSGGQGATEENPAMEAR